MQHERKSGAGSKKGLYGFVIDEKTALRIIKASTETQMQEGARGMLASGNKSVFLKGAIIMKKENIKKVVLAYSGGLDTSIIIPWLKENYNNCEVVAVSGDVGQGTELDGLEEKAKATEIGRAHV